MTDATDIDTKMSGMTSETSQSAADTRSALVRIQQTYDECLRQMQTRPLLSQSLSSALICMLGAVCGSYTLLNDSNRSKQQQPKVLKQKSGVDWVEVCIFGLYGGLIDGPLSVYWKRWMKERGPESATGRVLFNQVLVQPFHIFIMYTLLHSIRTVASELVHATSHASSALPGTLAVSWACWPLSLYLLSKLVKKRRRYKIATSVCSWLWFVYIASKRRRTMQQQKQ